MEASSPRLSFDLSLNKKYEKGKKRVW